MKTTVLNLDPTLIEQVLINLVRNSIHALEGRLDKRIEIKSYEDESTTVIEVSDNGKGIPEKELKDIFIPFFLDKKRWIRHWIKSVKTNHEFTWRPYPRKVKG